jgi:acetyl esterase/lipase
MTGMLLPRLKAEGHPLPLGGMLISPLVTFDNTAPSFSAHASFDCLPNSMVHQDLTDLFPELKTIATNEEEVRQQHLAKVSPIHSDMTGLPPLLVSFGQRERFANDVEQYIARLVRHGVDVHVVSRHNEPHVYIVTPLLASSLRVWAKDCALLADWCSQRVKQSDVY